MVYERLFADVSSNNGPVEMERYANAGHVLLGVKSTEGTDYINPEHRTTCLHAGIHRVGVVHYHFARPDVNPNPDIEARHFLRNTMHLTGGRDYLCVDVERAVAAGWIHDPAWAFHFSEYVQANTRFTPWLYANRSTLDIPGEWLPGPHRPLWDADWSAGPDINRAGYTTAARQFTDGLNGPEPHSFAGIGRCDGNRMSTEVFRRALRGRH